MSRTPRIAEKIGSVERSGKPAARETSRRPGRARPTPKTISRNHRGFGPSDAAGKIHGFAFSYKNLVRYQYRHGPFDLVCLYAVSSFRPMDEKILTLHPQGKHGVRIDQAKYEAMKTTLLRLLGARTLTHDELTDVVVKT